MADDDLPTRLHWPADPLDPEGRERPAPRRKAPAAEADLELAPDPTPLRLPFAVGDEIAALRTEMAQLRKAVDDVAERVELRQIRAGLDELRSEVISLRRVVLEWPELEQLASDLAELRTDLLARDDDEPAGPGHPEVLAALVDLKEQLAAGMDATRPKLGALGPIVEELSGLREELVSLRRRIALRIQADDTAIDDAQIDRIADAVAQRLQRPPEAPAARRRR